MATERPWFLIMRKDCGDTRNAKSPFLCGWDFRILWGMESKEGTKNSALQGHQHPLCRRMCFEWHQRLDLIKFDFPPPKNGSSLCKGTGRANNVIWALKRWIIRLFTTRTYYTVHNRKSQCGRDIPRGNLPACHNVCPPCLFRSQNSRHPHAQKRLPPRRCLADDHLPSVLTSPDSPPSNCSW